MSHGATFAARAAWRSMPAMLTANRALALTLIIAAACGPDIDISSGATSDAGSTTTDPATTGLGASESGPGEPCASSGDSGGEPPPVCAVLEADAGPTCICDGMVSDPEICGCADGATGQCVCGPDNYHAPCVRPCAPATCP